MPEIKPRLMKSSAKTARSDASRMSAKRASSIPQPTAGPFTAAITGFSHSSAAIAAGVGSRLMTGVLLPRCSPVIISLTSSPEQKAGSAPVTITQRTASSRVADAKACAISA